MHSLQTLQHLNQKATARAERVPDPTTPDGPDASTIRQEIETLDAREFDNPDAVIDAAWAVLYSIYTRLGGDVARLS